MSDPKACFTPCEECNWAVRDDSFSHEFGTHIDVYEECEACGATRTYDPPDYDWDDLDR